MKKLFLLIVIIMLLNCAYFNTFYNAQYYFSLAEKSVEQGNRPRREDLEKAIEKSTKILQFYSDSKYVDDALIVIGKSYLYLDEYTKAIRKFSELMQYYPESEFYNEAIFYTGETYRIQEEYELATHYYMQLLNNKEYRIKCLDKLINIYINKKEYEKADTILSSIEYDKIKNNTIKFLFAKIKYNMKKYKEAIEYLKKIKISKLSKINQFEYHTIYAEIYIKSGNYDKAEKIISKGLKHFTDLKKKNSLILLKAKIMIDNGKYEKAILLIEDVIAQGRNVVLKDSFLFLEGEIYEQYLIDYDKAIEKYTVIKNNFRNSNLIPASEIKIMSLNLLKEIESDTVKNEERLIKNKFLLAEINYLNLRKIDLSIKYYSQIVDSYPNSFYAPKSLYALAYINFKEFNNKIKAETYLRKIIEDYSNTEFVYPAENLLRKMNNEEENN